MKKTKADNKDLFGTSSYSTDASDEFINLPDIPPLEGDERVKEIKGLKILTPNKLLTRPLLVTQIKAGTNSYKFKNEIRQIMYLLYQHVMF